MRASPTGKAFGWIATATALVVISVPTSSLALYTTPDSARAFTFSPLEFDTLLINPLSAANQALLSQGYDPTIYKQSVYDSDGSLSVSFINEISTPFGACSIFTHGTQADSLVPGTGGEPAMEFFKDFNLAFSKWVALYSSGLVTIDETEVREVVHRHDPPDTVYAIVLLSSGISRLSHARNAIMHVAASYGGGQYSNWVANGSGTMATYYPSSQIDTARTDALLFWNRLEGLQGQANRTVANAKLGTGLVIYSPNGGDDHVLAPWLTEVFPPNNYYINGPQVGYLSFDTAMDTTLSTTSMVTTTDALEFWGGALPEWSAPFSLDYKLFPKATGTGKLYVYGSQILSSGGIQMNTSAGNPIPGDTLIYFYDCYNPSNPTVGFDRVLATTGSSGNSIDFSTLWEHNTSAFTVERVAGPLGGQEIPSIPASGTGGPGTYGALDPGGFAGARYRIIEHQTGGRPDIPYELFEAAPAATIYATEPITYDQDSLAALGGAIGNGATFAEGFDDPPLGLLIAPDSVTSSLGWYKSLWESRGVTTGIVSLSQTDAHGGIAPYIQWAYDRGARYALLVGDANDALWWDDPAKWTNGWNWPRVAGTGPHVPSQPERNLIPTFYTAEVDSPARSMSFYTPYYATDLPYVDVDSDGLPDLAIGRIPVASRNDVFAYTAKLASYLEAIPPSSPRTALMTYAPDNGLVLGRHVEEDADSVALEFPQGTNLSRLTDTNATLWTYAHRESLADSVANTWPDRIVWLASGSGRTIYANYWRVDQGWSMSHLVPPSSPGHYFISLGFSCGLGNFDQTEDYTSCDSTGPDPAACSGPIQPIPERLLLDPQTGAIAVLGPTRGTYQPANAILAREFVRQFSSGLDLGTAFMMAQRKCIVDHPEYVNVFRSYVLLGDPLPTGSMVTAVASEAPSFRPGLGLPKPNPFNPSTVLTMRLPWAGRVDLRVFDVHGHLVRTLMNGETIRAGITPVRWDGRNDYGDAVASGVYVARLTADRKTYEQKLVMLK